MDKAMSLHPSVAVRCEAECSCNPTTSKPVHDSQPQNPSSGPAREPYGRSHVRSGSQAVSFSSRTVDDIDQAPTPVRRSPQFPHESEMEMTRPCPEPAIDIRQVFGMR